MLGSSLDDLGVGVAALLAAWEGGRGRGVVLAEDPPRRLPPDLEDMLRVLFGRMSYQSIEDRSMPWPWWTMSTTSRKFSHGRWWRYEIKKRWLVEELGPAEADWEELEEDGGKGEAVGRSCWPDTSLQVP